MVDVSFAIGKERERDPFPFIECMYTDIVFFSSYVRPATLVRICDECNFGSFQGRCVVCGGPGVADAYYCVGCTRLEKDREGCPKIINLGTSKTDLFYERKKFGFKKR